MKATLNSALAPILCSLWLCPVAGAAETPDTSVYFGAVHVHTAYSFDAYTNGTLATPADAYRWARGEAITSPAGAGPMQIAKALDFYAVSDHAEWLGSFKMMENPDSPMAQHPLAPDITSDDRGTAFKAFARILAEHSAGNSDPDLNNAAISQSVWQDIVATADTYYQPGEFTTFPAYEWTANPKQRNLHRVVLFGDSKGVPDQVLSSHQSNDPETLWAWMDQLRGDGATVMAIPHNANASDGLMFSLQTYDGEPIDEAYVRQRMRNEPLYEITQIKGTSETYPTLSPNDEFAAFEIWDYTLAAAAERPEHHRGSYARQALLDGLSLQNAGIGNPFAYGFIGDSDTHNGAASHEEFNFTGKFAFEKDPEARLEGMPQLPAALHRMQLEFSSGGLAAIWATDNSREALFEAMQRRETYGTTGPQIKLRFFGGWSLKVEDASAADLAQRGYRGGVAMGSTLPAAPTRSSAPGFLLWAAKDPQSGNLDRVQVIKGWIDNEGRQHEKIYNVAWAGERQPDQQGQLPPVGNTVDIASASYKNTIGSAQLVTYWQDPDFDPRQHAFYYARVLEIPTPRWTSYDAAALNTAPPAGIPATLQERAYSSPIWYQP